MTTHPHPDALCSCGANSKEDRARLARMPAHITLIEGMVLNQIDVCETETFAAMFGLLDESKVA